MDLPRVVCEYEDVFSDELLGLPPQRDVDFCIELRPSTSDELKSHLFLVHFSVLFSVIFE